MLLLGSADGGFCVALDKYFNGEETKKYRGWKQRNHPVRCDVNTDGCNNLRHRYGKICLFN